MLAITTPGSLAPSPPPGIDGGGGYVAFFGPDGILNCVLTCDDITAVNNIAGEDDGMFIAPPRYRRFETCSYHPPYRSDAGMVALFSWQATKGAASMRTCTARHW
jgi:hypothetical protein